MFDTGKCRSRVAMINQIWARAEPVRRKGQLDEAAMVSKVRPVRIDMVSIDAIVVMKAQRRLRAHEYGELEGVDAVIG
jgi:hypothetical protein